MIHDLDNKNDLVKNNEQKMKIIKILIVTNHPDSITTLDLRCIPLVKHRQGCTLFTTFSRSRTIVVYWCAISWC